MAGLVTRLTNKPELFKKLDKLAGESAKKAMDSTMGYMRKYGPTAVARAVVMRYNIKQGEIKPTNRGGSSIKAGGSSVNFGGTTLADMTLVYFGRLLTPIHFNMSATSGRIYKIKATILKGHRVQIGHHGPPYSEGGQYARGNETPYWLTANSRGGNQKTLPFQRSAGGSGPDKVMKTISIPQMVSHESVGPKVLENLQEMALTKLEQNMKRFLG